jgi:hypothetical protein
LDDTFGYRNREFNLLNVRTGLMLRVAATCRIPLSADARGHQLYEEIIAFCLADPDQYLDVIHATLQIDNYHGRPEELEIMLAYGGSAWQASKSGLRRRVGPTTQFAFDAATTPDDIASQELAEAWQMAYGREPNPSDAWNHAIKAAEAVLIPMVTPTQVGAHMGHVLGELSEHGEKWTALLRFNQTKEPRTPPITSVQATVGMLRLLYPNPDRHIGLNHREPSLKEAQAIVNLAVTIVQWCHDNSGVPFLTK